VKTPPLNKYEKLLSEQTNYRRNLKTTVNKILKEAETEIVESKYDQQIKENIIETSKVRIDNLLSRFQDIIIQFNSKFINQIEVSNETFSHIDKLEYLSKLQPTTPSEIDVNAVD
jgi:hypothetical protein